jgi:UDP-N-acetylglucosamine 2-epimerase (non-hydrolysing)/GDP/UDP-N,N'-diacetylbacillosamine 2-epimerase (hydrolysing)
MEAASFAVPVVNVGLRQQGRERAGNVLDAEAKPESILKQIAKAQSQEFRCSLAGMKNPYGDGHAAERIVEALALVPLSEDLLLKKAAPL